MYLSYEDYKNMGGTLDETTFDDLAFEASTQIDWYTFGRLRSENYESLAKDVKKCMYHIIKLIRDEQLASSLATDSEGDETNGTASTIVSQSNDGVSISYNVLSASDAVENAKTKIEQSIKRYLAYVKNSLGRKVLYRGVYPGE